MTIPLTTTRQVTAAGDGGQLRPSAAATSAMSLYQKYSDLNSGIERARADRALLEEQFTSLEQEIETIETEAATLEHESRVAEAETHLHQSELQGLQEELSELRKERSGKERTITRRTQQLEVMNQCLREDQIRYLEDSRLFRMECKRLRLEAVELGIPHAFLSAFQVSLGESSLTEITIFDKADKNDLNLMNDDERNGEANDDAVLDLRTEDVTGDDDELKSAIEEYHKEKAACEALQSELDELHTISREDQGKSDATVERQAQLQQQLERIRQENGALAKEIRELRRSTEEALCCAKAYLQSKKNNSSRKRTNGPAPQNPYRKSAIVESRPAEEVEQRSPNSELRSIVLGPALASRNNVPSMQRRQRYRKERFGSTFHIQGERMADTSSFEVDSTTPTTSVCNRFSASQPIRGGQACAKGNGFDVAKRDDENGRRRDVTGVANLTSILDDDEVDDEEEALLSFIPFRKRK